MNSKKVYDAVKADIIKAASPNCIQCKAGSVHYGAGIQMNDFDSKTFFCPEYRKLKHSVYYDMTATYWRPLGRARHVVRVLPPALEDPEGHQHCMHLSQLELTTAFAEGHTVTLHGLTKNRKNGNLNDQKGTLIRWGEYEEEDEGEANRWKVLLDHSIKLQGRRIVFLETTNLELVTPFAKGHSVTLHKYGDFCHINFPDEWNGLEGTLVKWNVDKQAWHVAVPVKGEIMVTAANLKLTFPRRPAMLIPCTQCENGQVIKKVEKGEAQYKDCPVCQGKTTIPDRENTPIIHGRRLPERNPWLRPLPVMERLLHPEESVQTPPKKPK